MLARRRVGVQGPPVRKAPQLQPLSPRMGFSRRVWTKVLALKTCSRASLQTHSFNPPHTRVSTMARALDIPEVLGNILMQVTGLSVKLRRRHLANFSLVSRAWNANALREMYTGINVKGVIYLVKRWIREQVRRALYAVTPGDAHWSVQSHGNLAGVCQLSSHVRLIRSDPDEDPRGIHDMAEELKGMMPFDPHFFPAVRQLDIHVDYYPLVWIFAQRSISTLHITSVQDLTLANLDIGERTWTCLAKLLQLIQWSDHLRESLRSTHISILGLPSADAMDEWVPGLVRRAVKAIQALTLHQDHKLTVETHPTKASSHSLKSAERQALATRCPVTGITMGPGFLDGVASPIFPHLTKLRYRDNERSLVRMLDGIEGRLEAVWLQDTATPFQIERTDIFHALSRFGTLRDITLDRVDFSISRDLASLSGCSELQSIRVTHYGLTDVDGSCPKLPQLRILSILSCTSRKPHKTPFGSIFALLGCVPQLVVLELEVDLREDAVLPEPPQGWRALANLREVYLGWSTNSWSGEASAVADRFRSMSQRRVGISFRCARWRCGPGDLCWNWHQMALALHGEGTGRRVDGEVKSRALALHGEGMGRRLDGNPRGWWESP